MCGFAGFWQSSGDHHHLMSAKVRSMALALRHRGPDDSGDWVDPSSGIALGFARLSIQDLSPCGHQPMASESGRYQLTFNGEVYNFRTLRQELEGKGYRFRGHSDTEVMLAAFEAWGVEASVKRFVGMFAFALWDRDRRELTLVRDRLGIKPLYYGLSRGVLLWGSELKALQAHPDFVGEIDRGSLTLFLRHNAIPAPYSIYQGIQKLPPGSILTLRAPDAQPCPSAYWSPIEVISAGFGNRYTGTEEEAISELDRILKESVRLRMIADVPLGALLSGGIDSSMVAALMQDQSRRPIQTFSIGFEEAEFNEASHAAAVAGYLGTDHRELYVTPKEALETIPLLPEIYDEPFSDASQIPTYLVCKLTRKHVTVCLSGDGGDELFFGYSRYFTADAIWKKIGWMPLGLRETASGLVKALIPGRRGEAWSDLMAMENFEALYRRMMSHWKRPESVVIDGHEPTTTATVLARRRDFSNRFTHMSTSDLIGYLPDDILTKVDRASMAVGLEARVPLLDHRVVEFAARLPRAMKVKHGQGKWILRRLLARYVTPSLTDRPKMGFGVPLAAWLRGPLRPWAEELLSEERLKREGWFHPGPIRKKWTEHLAGNDWHFYLWDILMFQAWHSSLLRSSNRLCVESTVK